MRFNLRLAVEMSMFLCWVVAPCELIRRKQFVGGTYCLHPQIWV